VLTIALPSSTKEEQHDEQVREQVLQNAVA
jgi:hypothetical protein